jgi:hypothetical protein
MPSTEAADPTMWDWITRGLAVWGAALSTYVVALKRRRRLRVSAEFTTAKLGPIRNHTFFIVEILNVGERAVTIRRVEWVAPGMTSELVVFRLSAGEELPEKVEPDAELRILFDPDKAAAAISERATSRLDVIDAHDKAWPVTVSTSMREFADEQLETVRSEG